MKWKALRDALREKMQRKQSRNGFLVVAVVCLTTYHILFSLRDFQSGQMVFETTAMRKYQSSWNLHDDSKTATVSETSARTDPIHSAAATTTATATTMDSNNSTANLALSDTNNNGKINEIFQTNPVAFDGTALNTALHTNTTPPFSSATSSAISPTIVLQLRGEMGNHMGVLAQGKALQLALRDAYGLTASLVIRPETSKKKEKKRDGRVSSQFNRVRDELRRCFPTVKVELSGGFTYDLSEYSLRQQQQEAWLSRDEIKNMRAFDTPKKAIRMLRIFRKPEHVKNGLELFHQLWNQTLKPPLPDNATISIPFLYTSAWPTFLQDRYYDEIRRLFTLDEKACCKEVPDPDESVFHFRNFQTEVRNDKLRFEELNPQRTAEELFGHLQPGDKVAITTRFNNAVTQEYVKQLQRRGLQVRTITGQSGVQDFCFLVKARKELVGFGISTFTTWAALLGDAKRARLYITNRSTMAVRLGVVTNWTHPILRSRMVYEVYDTQTKPNIMPPRAT